MDPRNSLKTYTAVMAFQPASLWLAREITPSNDLPSGEKLGMVIGMLYFKQSTLR